MPAAKGKVDVKVVLPQELKAQLDADATERGLDRSAWMTMVLQASYDEQGHSQAARLDQLIRDHVALREQVEQIAIGLRELVDALPKAPLASSKPVYPTPATLEETYPELTAMRQTVDQASLLPPKTPAPPAKGWGRWRR